MTGKFSVERLVHFNCAHCQQWWCIGDADMNVIWSCPRCGKAQDFKEAEPLQMQTCTKEESGRGGTADTQVSEACPHNEGGGSNPLDRTEEAKSIIQEWVDKQGHERCWYYPDLFRRLADIFGVKPSVQPNLPPREEFEDGCRRYQDEQYCSSGDMPDGYYT